MRSELFLKWTLDRSVPYRFFNANRRSDTAVEHSALAGACIDDYGLTVLGTTFVVIGY